MTTRPFHAALVEEVARQCLQREASDYDASDLGKQRGQKLRLPPAQRGTPSPSTLARLGDVTPEMIEAGVVSQRKSGAMSHTTLP